MINSVVNNVITYLRSNITADTYVLGEYPDLDKYKNPTTVYFLTPDYEFEELSSDHKLMRFSLEIYVVYQKNQKDNMKNQAASLLDAVYTLVKGDPSLNSTVDYAMISSIRVYDGVEGADNARAVYIKIDSIKEI
ncbi:MAG TPA: hypothetical protein P5098_02295 [Candidatus Dojkabacteria bacterium]|nr:hypothetical protein [Candidatus Dojkabacteria bacterium]